MYMSSANTDVTKTIQPRSAVSSPIAISHISPTGVEVPAGTAEGEAGSRPLTQRAETAARKFATLLLGFGPGRPPTFISEDN
jgi:hypothetical protein